MNDIDKYAYFVFGLAFLFGCVMFGTAGCSLHNNPILDEASVETNLKYFIESDDNTTKIEKYILAESICTKAYEKIDNELWLYSDKNIDDLIDKCIINLVS